MAVPPITYVRHAMPMVDDHSSPTEWHLDVAVRAAAEEWAGRLEVGDGIGALVSSTEPKALETAAAIGRAVGCARVEEDPRLREALRPWIGTGYRAVAHRYLRGEQPDGWEAHAAVADRMAAAVADALERAGDGPAVVVSHGLALSLHLGDRLGAGLRPGDLLEPPGLPRRVGARRRRRAAPLAAGGARSADRRVGLAVVVLDGVGDGLDLLLRLPQLVDHQHAEHDHGHDEAAACGSRR